MIAAIAVMTSAIAGRPAIGATFPRSAERDQCDQRSKADRNLQGRDRRIHGWYSVGNGRRANAPTLQKAARNNWSPKWRSRSLIVQLEYETFAPTERYIRCSVQ
jgi:hypothetical protein